MSKKFFLLVLSSLLVLCTTNSFGQKNPKNTGGKKQKSLVKLLPKPKIEVEDWKIFEEKNLKLKIAFPKEPTLSVSDKVTFDSEAVKSSILQSYINGTFYMVEVREYAENTLPDKLDLAESYAAWLKTFILPRTKIISEKIYDYEFYKIVEFVYQQTETDILIHRNLVVGNNLYQIILQLEIKKPDNFEQTLMKNQERVKKFFDSFEITEKSLGGSTVY